MNDENSNPDHKLGVSLSLPSLAGYRDSGRVLVVALVVILTWYTTPADQLHEWRTFAGGLLAGLAAAPSGAAAVPIPAPVLPVAAPARRKEEEEVP